ncbi:molybdopterin-dependent oxidoreductase [Paucibacter sp. AS339]|uniref:molybdopterin-dependent oxidoreductase n=1 Tax=Paucibacter hankyongi TaxID=3133434 RepID=UPI0030A88AB7
MKHGSLPPGQHERDDFPRFGLLPFAHRFPARPHHIDLRVCGAVRNEIELDAASLARLPRVEQNSDFHCVTGWSQRGLRWSGVRLREVYAQLILPLAGPADDALFVVLRGQDGARCSLPLADLLADDVLLADRLNGQTLTISHGAPLRLVAPAHYGYKNIKHLCRLEFHRDLSGYRPSAYRFMEHPRARVAAEERGQGLPGWLLRLLYRPLIQFTATRFARASTQYQRDGGPLP